MEKKKKVVAVVIGLELIGRNPFDLSSEEQRSDAEFVSMYFYILRITSKSEPTTPDYAS